MKKNLIPSFASTFYSLAHESIYDQQNKARLAKQIQCILMDFSKKQSMKKKVCLDIGCATGTITDYLSILFDNTIGIDVDEPAIKKAQKQYQKKSLRFEVGSGEKLKYKNNSFDAVICHEAYSYLEHPDLLLEEIYRVLKVKGICFFSADNFLFPIESQYRLPFLLYLPDSLAKLYLRLRGYKQYYLGRYKTYWQLKKLCKNFIVHDYTLKILMNPQKYQFSRLLKYKKIVDFVPDPVLSLLYYFLPTYIWILEKPRNSRALYPVKRKAL